MNTAQLVEQPEPASGEEGDEGGGGKRGPRHGPYASREQLVIAQLKQYYLWYIIIVLFFAF